MPHHYNKTKKEITRKEAKKIGIEIKEPRVYGPGGRPPTKKELDKRFEVKYPHAKKRKPLPPPAPHPDARPKPQPPTKRGYAMKMGSKQKNTASNFSGSAFKMVTGIDPSGGLQPQAIEFLNSFANIDPESSLGQNTLKEQKENFEKAKSGYQPPLELVSKNTSGSPEAYASLGAGLAKLIKPKEGTEGYARQQERRANREVKRFERGGIYSGEEYDAAVANQKTWKGKKGTQTKVGEALRNIKKKIFK